jgi:hypothetical protein
MVTVTNNLLIFQVFMATLKLEKLQYPFEEKELLSPT